MALESPNQYGDKGNKGSAPSGQGGKLVSPNQVGDKGGMGAAPDNVSGNIAGPAKTNAAEANGHGDGRSAKGNDAPKHRTFMS